MKRICLFAGYDVNHVIHDYVIYYLTELSKLADVYYFSDNDMTDAELSKLDGITKKAYSSKHNKYDFGSWQALINAIGWSEIEQYDQLMLVNDSCYGTLFNLDNILENNEPKYDFWGMSESHAISHHIQSYFLVLNNKVLMNNNVRLFFAGVEQQQNFIQVVRKYEIGLSTLLKAQGFRIGAYLKNQSKRDINESPVMLIKKYQMPLLKVKVLTGTMPSMNLYSSIIKTIKNNTNYDPKLIEKHISSKNISLPENSLRVFCKFINKRIVPAWLFSAEMTGDSIIVIKFLKVITFLFKVSC